MCRNDNGTDICGIIKNVGKMTRREASMQNVYVLAFLGDSVYSLIIKEKIVLHGNMKAGEMHNLCVGNVNAEAQARAFLEIKDILTEEEMSVYKRARNARSTHTPKNMPEGAYHSATGIEALFGFLYLCGDFERIYCLADKFFPYGK